MTSLLLRAALLTAAVVVPGGFVALAVFGALSRRRRPLALGTGRATPAEAPPLVLSPR
jgi:hypothetical protein